MTQNEKSPERPLIYVSIMKYDCVSHIFAGLFSEMEVRETAEGATDESGRPYWRYTIFYVLNKTQYFVVGDTWEEAFKRLEANALKACPYEES